MQSIFRTILISAFLLQTACTTPSGPAPGSPGIGKFTAYDEAFHRLVPADAKIEKLVEGFTWSEGPAWVGQGGYLLFTDVPENTLYRWSQRAGLSVFLKPSGYAGPPLEELREAGANGLHADADGKVLLADSGSRLVAALDLVAKTKTTLASHYEGKRFNSPNDLVRHANGAIFFTDPPYGLKGIEKSPARELSFSGVYRLDPDGTVHLLDDSLDFPNGIALSHDQRTLYVANSDPARPIWMAYALDAAGNVAGKRVFADATDLMGEGVHGLPDGMDVASDGTLFATGPGGVIVFDPQGKRLGRIETGTAIANCAFGDDGRTLYMTSHTFLARVRLNTRGAGFGP